MKKRVLTLALVVALGMSTLTGACGKSADTGAEATESSMAAINTVPIMRFLCTVSAIATEMESVTCRD